MNSDEVNLNQEKLSIKEKIGYGFGHVFNDLCSAMWFSYFILFMTKFIGFSALNAGILLLIGQIADAIATPLIGIESDRINPSWYNKRMVWHLFGTIAVVVSFVFIFIPCPFTNLEFSMSGHWSLMVYYTPFIIIFQIGWAMVQIAHLSLVSDLSFCPNARTQLNSIRNSMSVIAGISIYVSFWLIFGLADNSKLNKEDYKGYQWVAISITILGSFLSILHHVLLSKMKTISVSNTESEGPILDFRYWIRSNVFYRVILGYMLSRIILNISQIYIILFLVESTPFSKTFIAIGPLVIYISGLITSVIMPIILKRLSTHIVMIFGILISFILSVWVYLLGQSNSSLISEEIQTLFCCALIGISTNILIISSFKQVTDMISIHTTSNAFVMGIMSFADKLFNGLVVVGIQYAVPLKNNFPGIVISKRSKFYQLVVSLLPTACCFVILILMIVNLIFPFKYYIPTSDQIIVPSNERIIYGEDRDIAETILYKEEIKIVS